MQAAQLTHAPKTLLLAALAATGLVTSPAHAFTIELTNVSLSLNPGNTADDGGSNGSFTFINTPDGGGGNPYGDTGTIDGGGIETSAVVGTVLDASTRYAGSVWRSQNSEGTYFFDSDYRLTFDVFADAGVEYDLVIQHDLEAVLHCTSSKGSSCSEGEASVSDVTASVLSAGGGIVGGDLVQATALLMDSEAQVDLVVAPAALTLTGLTGDQTIVIDFTWTSTAKSKKRSNDDDEESSVRFGVQPDDGPKYGSPATDAPGDGHFLDIQATVTAVPEPALATVLAIGLAALALRSRTRG